MSQHVNAIGFGFAFSLFAVTAVSAADYEDLWKAFQDDLTWGDPPAWQPVTRNYPMSVGLVERADVVTAWRRGTEIGAYLRYVYAEPVSPAELPGPGPMKFEEVEATLDCAARTARIHRMYLYAPDQRQIGTWYDPEAAANPASFGASSMMGMAAAAVC